MITFDVARNKLAQLLPVTYDAPFGYSSNQKLLTSFALQRTGQHVIIDWICRGLRDVVHLNHCRFFKNGAKRVLSPKTGRRIIYQDGDKYDSGIQGRDKYKSSLGSNLPDILFYTIEGIGLNCEPYGKLLSKFKPFTIVILRDPANWLASSIAHGRLSKDTLLGNIQILKEHLKYALDSESGAGPVNIAIDYNKFVRSRNYRNKLAKSLGIADMSSAEVALNSTPDFGGGSSFKKHTETDTLSRWELYKGDPFFQSSLQDPELIDLAKKFFETSPGLPTF